MRVHGQEEPERERKTILAETRASLMSDTKWRKLLAALGERGISDLQWVVKFVGYPTEHLMQLPTGLHPPWPWVETYKFGAVPLRAIEWILLPRIAEYRRADRTVPVRKVEQDLDEPERIIAALGRYPVERTDRGLLILGYLQA